MKTRSFVAKPVLVLGSLLAVSACGGGGTAPELAADASDEIVLGAQMYAANCAACHGAGGGGGLGPQLSEGKVFLKYPDADSTVQFVLVGASSMPAFGERLSPEEVDAVVLYVREILNP